MNLIIHLGRRLATLSDRSKTLTMLGADAVALPTCMVLAVTLRLGSFDAAISNALVVQITLALLTLPVLGLAGLYRAVVRHIDLRVFLASGIALAIAVLVVYAIARGFHVDVLPRSALVIYWFVAFVYVALSRFIARAVLQRGLSSAGRTRHRTAIYGAGDAGAQLVRAMMFSTEYKPVCFVDDRPRLQGKTVAGLNVYGPDLLPEAVFRHDVEQIVVAIPSATSAQKRRLIERVKGIGLPVKILPGLVELVDGSATVSALREIDVADLLGRDAVPPDSRLFARNIASKVVMVTGAGGSIGGELCRQIVSQRPSKLLMLDHSEYSLYSIDQELRQWAHGIEIIACLGSVLDGALVRALLADHRVETIYHAAAYKHVPIVEANANQGVRNNVFGTVTVAKAAVEAGVQTCVLVSTDKAVRPTNVMGASKRAAELVFQAAALQSPGCTVFSMVRFGNVLDSSGSVVPLFRRQIQAGGPVTITHPDITRYFMLIPEAAQLVIQAGAMAEGGDVFVLDMGEPIRIAELARSMIRLSGLNERGEQHPDGIEIQYVGLRPGEKLYEELLIGKDVMPSGHQRILRARERHVDPTLLDKMLMALLQACNDGGEEPLRRQLRNLVPEFRQAEEVNAEVSKMLARR